MTNYHAYLIRFWREDDGSPWRGELVLPQTGEKRYFATADQLFAFLADQLPDNVTTEQREPTEPEKSRIFER